MTTLLLPADYIPLTPDQLRADPHRRQFIRAVATMLLEADNGDLCGANDLVADGSICELVPMSDGGETLREEA